MPQAAAIWVGTAVISLLGATTAAVVAGSIAAAFAYVGVVLAISYSLSAVSQALVGRPKGLGSPRYRDMVIKATTAPRAIVYGECTVGGVLVFEHTTGTKNEFLDFVVVVAGHQIESITDVWFDDVKIVNADIGSGAAGGGAVAGSGDFRARDGTTVAYIYKFVGSAGQTASSVLTASDGSGYGVSSTWTSDHRLRGCAYVHIRLRRNEKAYGNGAPSNFKFKVKGAKVYDPRLDSTNGGSGTHRLTDATTWAWSNNPALCVADYIVGGTIVNDTATPVRKRGFGAATADVDWPAVIAAANICEESVTIPSSSQDRYECDGVLYPSDDNPDADCLDQLLTSMLGNVTYTNGKYVTYAGAYQSPVYTLTEADLAGPLQYVTAKGRAERYNTVRGTRQDLDSGQALEFLSRTDSAYVTADGRTLYHDIDLPMTQNEYRAQRIGQIILRRSREMQSIVWPGQLSAAKIAVWETVQVTVSELGITSKIFRCIGRKTRPTSEGEPIVELLLREEASATYTDPSSGDYGSLTVASDLGPVTGSLDAPTDLTVTSAIGGLQFTITPDNGAGSAEIYDLYEYTASTPFSSASKIWSGSATSVFVPKADTTTRYYWVKARRYQYESTNYPATTGVSGTPLDDLYRIIPDPYFSRATAQTYWEWGSDTGVAITLTGGVTGGVLTLTGNSTNKTVYSKRAPVLRVVTGQQFNMYIRYRRTGTISGTDSIDIGGTTVSEDLVYSNTMTGSLTITGIQAKTVNEWQEANTVITVANLPKNQGQLPCGRFWVYLGSGTTGGAIEIDAIVVTAI